MRIAKAERGGGAEIIVWGPVSQGNLDALAESARETLAGGRDPVVLDLRSASVEGSAFIGTVARLAMEARSRARTFVVRADGRVADWLAWSGLQRVARLEVFSGPEPAESRAGPGGEGGDLP